jgi:hypothetical protein
MTKPQDASPAAFHFWAIPSICEFRLPASLTRIPPFEPFVVNGSTAEPGMAKLKDKIENGLNDVRILILGGQVLIGAGFRTFFESGFDRLSRATQIAQLCGLGVMLVGLGPLLLPAAFHRIVEKGEATVRFKRLLNNALGFGLFPFALGLAVDLFMSGEKIGGPKTAWISGIASGVLALGLWYGIEYTKQDRSKKSVLTKRAEEDEQERRERGGESLTDKIKQVLTELRMVLPGTQALLGFQFVIILMPDFEKIPAHSKWIHLGSLAAVAISAILLITPAAYHRIVEHGEDSEEFHDFAGRILLFAMLFLGLGLAADFFIVVQKISGSLPIACLLAVGLLAFFLLLWFGYTTWKRQITRKRIS